MHELTDGEREMGGYWGKGRVVLFGLVVEEDEEERGGFWEAGMFFFEVFWWTNSWLRVSLALSSGAKAYPVTSKNQRLYMIKR